MADNQIERSQLIIARYWKPLASLLSLFAAATAAVPALAGHLGLTLGAIPGHQWPGSVRAVVLTAAVFLFAFVRSPRVAAVITRLILGAPRAATEVGFIFRGPRPYGEADTLPDRRADLEECWLKIQERPVFILEGESGCGKSSLLSAGLIPRARARFRVVTARVGDDPIGHLHAALSAPRPSAGGRALEPKDLLSAIEVQAKSEAARRAGEPSTPTLVCLDQCEELFTSVMERARLQFTAVLHRAVAEGWIRLVFVIRSDFRDLLDKLLRTVDPDLRSFSLTNDFVLRPFSGAQAQEILTELLQPIHAGDPLLREQVERFSGNLVQELLRPPRDQRIHPDDDKTVLPVELQIVGYVIQRLGSQHFTRSRLAALGGKAGLFRRYIDDVTRDVMRMTGVGPERTLDVLRVLASEGRGRAVAQHAESIGATVRLPQVLVVKVLEELARHYIVSRLPDEPDGPSIGAVGRYELMHDHLAVILAETPDRRVQRAREAEERLKFWMERTEAAARLHGQSRSPGLASRMRAAFTQSVPILETVRLWRPARGAARAMLRRNLLAFVLRVSVFLLLPVAALGASWFTDAAQIQFMIMVAPVADVSFVYGLDEEAGPGSLAVGWVRALGRAGRLHAAVAAAKKIRFGAARTEAMVAVCESFVQAGRTTEGLAAAKEILSPERPDVADDEERTLELIAKARALADLAQLMKRAERVDDAKRLRDEAFGLVHDAAAGRIRNPVARALALADVARVAAVAGQSAAARRAGGDAITAVHELDNFREQRWVMPLIVEALLEAKLNDLARRIAAEVRPSDRDVQNPVDRGGYLAGRARGLADASLRTSAFEGGRAVVAIQVQEAAEEAIVAARDLPDDESRVLLLLNVTGPLVVAGEPARAAQVAHEALAIARRSTNPIRRGKMFAMIVRGLVAPGLAEVAKQASDEAVSGAPAIADPATRGIVLAAAANRLAGMGHLEPAKRAADASSDLLGYVTETPEACAALLDLARAYSRLGSVWRAQLTMRGCRFIEPKMAAYIFILNNYADAQRAHRIWWWW